MQPVDGHQRLWCWSERAGYWSPPKLEPICHDVRLDGVAFLLASTYIGSRGVARSLPAARDTQYLLHIAETTTTALTVP